MLRTPAKCWAHTINKMQSFVHSCCRRSLTPIPAHSLPYVYLFIFLSISLAVHLPTIYIFTYLSMYLPIHLASYLFACLHVRLSSNFLCLDHMNLLARWAHRREPPFHTRHLSPWTELNFLTNLSPNKSSCNLTTANRSCRAAGSCIFYFTWTVGQYFSAGQRSALRGSVLQKNNPVLKKPGICVIPETQIHVVACSWMFSLHPQNVWMLCL